MNKEIIDKLKSISKHGEHGRHFYMRNEDQNIMRLIFNGYVDGELLYKIMEVVHIDGFRHRGGTTIMEVEEKWEEDDF